MVLSASATSDGPLLEFFKCIIARLRRVDSENHALTTMRGRDFLSAIKPEGLRGFGNENRSDYGVIARSNELKPGIESIVEMSARILEG